MSNNGNFFGNLINDIADGLVGSFASFVTGLILGLINPILTGIGFDPISL